MNPNLKIPSYHRTCFPGIESSLTASAACPPPTIDAGVSQLSRDGVAAKCTTENHSKSTRSSSCQKEIAVPRAELPHGQSGRHATPTTSTQGRHDDDTGVSEDSEDEFVYMLQNAKSTTQAIEMIRRIQRTRRFTVTALSSRVCSSYSLDSSEKIKRSVSPASQCSRLSEDIKKKDQQGVELPETILDFQTAPAYTVSLTAAREAIFEDALSGFRSYLEQEDRKMEAFHLYSLRRSAQEKGSPIDYERTFCTHNGVPCVTVVPVYSSENAEIQTLQERSQSQSGSNPPGPVTFRQAQQFNRITEKNIPERGTSTSCESLEQQMQGQYQQSCVKSSDFPLNSSSDCNVQENKGTCPAAKVRTLLDDQSQSSYPLHYQEEGLETSCVQKSLPNKEGDTACLRDDISRDPQLGRPNEEQRDTCDAQYNNKKGGVDEASHEDAQQLVDLVEQEFMRVQAPQLFQYRYPLEIQVATEPGNRASTFRTALYASRSYSIHQYRGSSSYRPVNFHLERERIDQGGHITRPFNKVRGEWIYVWEQFKRDIHRETLLIEEVNYRDPNEAVAAIISYLEYCYDRGQAVYLKRKAESEEEERLAREVQRSEGDNRFFSLLFREGAAAIKETVENARKTLTGLLSATGVDLAAQRPTLVYSQDPLIRAVKIFDAAREVILASQQSFMGFPYQLLCEQLGTSRLPMMLEEFTRMEEASEEEEKEEVLASFSPPRELSGSPHLSQYVGQSGDVNGPTSGAINTREASLDREDGANAAGLKVQQREMQRRDRELRRRQMQEERMKRLPLLVGEPRTAEFKAFLSHVRSRVACMNAKDARYDKKETLTSGSSVTDPLANEANPKEDGFTFNQEKGRGDSKSSLFRDDVGSSVYLIPIDRNTDARSSASDEPSGGESRESSEQGVRIHLHFHKLRNVPVICVSKLFRLLTVPGFALSAEISSESFEAVDLEKGGQAGSESIPFLKEAEEGMPNASESRNKQHLPSSSSTTQYKQEKGVEKSLLILIQVQFTLFTNEEAEVRWRWYHV
ncbi:unnamed protein product [Phytomonas sp. EM1]|nr:unnamed protein product [Phytomonas sp. EM1]|eukprot:CCW60521.1 unnamed protein product [Phytomonas sp. isolate EM1]